MPVAPRSVEPASGAAKVLVVEDDAQVRTLVADALAHQGHHVRTAADGDQAMASLAAHRPDLVVLDLGLPGLGGVEVLRRIRDTGDDVAVVVVSARGGDGDRVAGLELGADDYVPKPVTLREVTARVAAVLRRTRRDVPVQPIVSGRLRIEPARRVLSVDGVAVEVPPRELDLLLHLVTHPSRAFSRADLLRDVWDSTPEWQDPSTVTVHVRRLRRRIEHDPTEPRHLVTVYGVGYRFDP